MNRYFHGFGCIFLSILFSRLHALVEHIRAGGFGDPKRQMSMPMGSGQKPHAGVVRVRIVDRQPHRRCLGRTQRPIARILMPGHVFFVARHLAEKV